MLTEPFLWLDLIKSVWFKIRTSHVLIVGRPTLTSLAFLIVSQRNDNSRVDGNFLELLHVEYKCIISLVDSLLQLVLHLIEYDRSTCCSVSKNEDNIRQNLSYLLADENDNLCQVFAEERALLTFRNLVPHQDLV